MRNGDAQGQPFGHNRPLRKALHSEAEPPDDRDRDQQEAQVGRGRRSTTQSSAPATAPLHGYPLGLRPRQTINYLVFPGLVT